MAKTMTPSWLHVAPSAPPLRSGRSAIVWIPSPETETLFSRPGVKKPRDCPSGDQNGEAAPSVLATRNGVDEASGRSQRASPFASEAMSAKVRPSGDGAHCVAAEPL